MKIGIIGKGNVGTALGIGLQREGHQIRYGHRDPKEPVQEAALFGDVIFMAVPFSAVKDAAHSIGKAAEGKILVDVTNVLDKNMDLAIGLTTSGAEELQKLLPRSKVVKAFNAVFAQNRSTGRVGDNTLTAFVAGEDPDAKRTIMGLARELGFEPLDVGSLKSARYLEPMAVLLINLGYGLNIGHKHRIQIGHGLSLAKSLVLLRGYPVWRVSLIDCDPHPASARTTETSIVLILFHERMPKSLTSGTVPMYLTSHRGSPMPGILHRSTLKQEIWAS